MQYRQLGHTGPTVSAMGLGCMGLSEGQVLPSAAEAKALLKAAHAAGVNFFDTADIYGMGDNERLLGKTFAKQRDSIVLASKGGIVHDPALPDVFKINNSPLYLRQALDASLQRLGVEQIDLYYLHGVKPRELEAAIAVLANCRRAGKIAHLGLAQVDAKLIRQAHAIHPLTAVQVEYSLVSRSLEYNDVLATCRELGIGIVAHSPLGRGLLTGKFTSAGEIAPLACRRWLQRIERTTFEQQLALVEVVKQVALSKGCTPAQCALAWVLARGDDIIPLPGCKTLRFCKENIETIEVVQLTTSELECLTHAAEQHAPVTDRVAASEGMTDEAM